MNQPSAFMVDLTAVSPFRAHGSNVQAQPGISSAADTSCLEERCARLEGEVRRLTRALEDVVALAQTCATPQHRLIQMQRRAIAAVSGLDAASRSR